MNATQLLAGFVLLGSSAVCSFGTPLPIGGTVIPLGTSIETGTRIATSTQAFTEPTFSGTLTAEVYQERSGKLTFTDQFTNTSGANGDIIVRLIDESFGQFTTDVTYDRLAPDEIAPTKATRSSSGNDLQFYFPDAAGVHPGQTSALVIIQTNATAFVSGESSLRDSYTANLTTFEPSTVPEPSSIMVLGACAAGLLMHGVAREPGSPIGISSGDVGARFHAA